MNASNNSSTRWNVAFVAEKSLKCSQNTLTNRQTTNCYVFHHIIEIRKENRENWSNFILYNFKLFFKVFVCNYYTNNYLHICKLKWRSTSNACRFNRIFYIPIIHSYFYSLTVFCFVYHLNHKIMDNKKTKFLLESKTHTQISMNIYIYDNVIKLMK